MKKHVKIYMDASGYDAEEYIPCEACGYPAVDIHHIERKGMGGSKKADEIGNLMALCRLCHAKAHAFPKIQKPILQRVHNAVIESWHQQPVDTNSMDGDVNMVKCRICKCGKLIIYHDDPVCSECGDDGVTERHGLGKDGVSEK